MSTEPMYRIRPLEWRQDIDSSRFKRWLGCAGNETQYRVTWEVNIGWEWSQVHRLPNPCDSLEHGQRRASEDHLSRLASMLEEVR